MRTTYVALLRGINVGGNNKLPMKDLARIFDEAGCGNVRTYIQSGNVVFDVEPQMAAVIPARVTASIAERFGFKVPVLLRATDEIQGVLHGNPFLGTGAEETALHVLFLAEAPEPDRVADLDPDRSRPDAFVVRGREVYLWLPNGVAHSKLTNGYFDSKLAMMSTGRNWRTVVRLFEMMSG
jgi:uncharacterized protein (DUF1697 family)